MEVSKLKGGGTCVRIVPGPNGISFDGAGQVKFMEAESTHKSNVRDVSFSLFLGGSNTGQGTNLPLKGTASIESGGDTNRPAFAKGLEKQNSCRGRVPVLGKAMTDCEISIFEAEKYFSAPEEKKLDETYESKIERSKSIRENSNSKARKQASKNKVLLSSPDLYESGNLISSPASSIVAVNRSFRPGPGTTPTASSQASCNSQSGLLSMAAGNSVSKMTANNRTKTSGKWAFACPCSCWNKRSVDIDDTPTENRRAPSVTSTALMDSPISSIRYSYPGLRKRVLSRSIENQRSEGCVETASEISDINRVESGTKSLRNSVDNIPQSGLSKGREQLEALRRNNDSQEEFRSNQRRTAQEDGFSFSILSVKPEEKPRQSLEVFGSPFYAREGTRKSASGMATQHHRHPSDLNRRSVLFDQARKSLTFDSNSEIHKFGGNDNEEDNESVTSSDLFEIESFTTQGTACYPLRSRRRDSLDDASSIQSGHPASSCCEALGFQSTFHFGEAVTPSAQSSYYEPSEASLDWSVTSGDTMGNFSLDYEEIKIMKRRASLQSSDLSRLREISLKGSSQRRSSGGSFLGCANAKAVSVAAPTLHCSQSTRYNAYGV